MPEAVAKLPYWTAVHQPLSELLTTAINLVDRDKRPELLARARGLPIWLLGHLRVARSTYEVIAALAKEREQITLGLDVAVVVPPLARVILESVFSVTFVFDDPSTRLPDFWKGAWAKLAEQHEQHVADHGGDPSWAALIAELATQRDGWRDDLDKQGTPLTPSQLADWKTVRWPNPGKMVKRCKDPVRRDVLDYLNARYYSPLSIAAHLSGTGMLAQTGHLLPGASEANQRLYFSRQFSISITMMLALLAQFAVDVVREAAFARRLIALWRYEHMPGEAVEVFSRCYQVRLEALAA